MLRTTLAVLLLLVAVPSAALAQRLPATVVPVHYDITVAPDLAAAKFTGEVAIRVRVEKQTSAITLNAAEITFGETSVTAAGRTQTAAVTLDEPKQQATLTLPSPVPAGDAIVAITYTGILNRDLRGLYLSEANGRRYAVTQLEATDARRMFPSFDEPAFKATFALTAIIDEKDSAISNGAVLADTPGPAGKRTIKFDTSPKMSTYLVALAVGDFVCNGATADGVPIRICATPDKKALTGTALEMAQHIFKYLNGYYSIRYPFKKLDVVAVPDFAAGAMENTAAIFYREELLLADASASLETRKTIAAVLAHEIAHQWFGNIVTMQWWDDLWLNEGFASWMESKPVAAWKPEWHVGLDDVQGNQSAMRLDALETTRAVRAKAETPEEINELFDPIAYNKGAAVIRMIEAWVGEEAFRKGVNAYIERYAYANARAEDFWNTLAASTGKPVDKVMQTFVDQPGLPLVTAELSCQPGAAAGEAVLAQQRYTTGGGAPATGQLWQIPVCLRGAGGETVCEVLDQRRETVRLPSCPPWVFANAGAFGYYRTAAATEMVGRIAKDIAPLRAEERMALLSDEWALVRAGTRDIGVFMDLAGGFGGERTAAVMRTLVGPLRTIGEDVAGDAARSAFRAWVDALLSPALEAVGWEPRPQEPADTGELRATVIGTLGFVARDREVLARAREIVARELDAPGTVDPTLLEVLVPLAALAGDAALYDRYLARSRAVSDPEEKYRYLTGLAAFADPALVRRTFDLALGEEVRSQDAPYLLAGLIAAPDSRQQAWTLVRERWAAVEKKLGGFGGLNAIVGVSGTFCAPADKKAVADFFAAHAVPQAQRTLQQTLERIEACAQLVAAQRPRLDAWVALRR